MRATRNLALAWLVPFVVESILVLTVYLPDRAFVHQGWRLA